MQSRDGYCVITAAPKREPAKRPKARRMHIDLPVIHHWFIQVTTLQVRCREHGQWQVTWPISLRRLSVAVAAGSGKIDKRTANLSEPGKSGTLEVW